MKDPTTEEAIQAIKDIQGVHTPGMTDTQRIDYLMEKNWLEFREGQVLKGKLAGLTSKEIGSKLMKVQNCPPHRHNSGFVRGFGRQEPRSTKFHPGWQAGDIGVSHTRVDQIFAKSLRRLRSRIGRKTDPAIAAICIFEAEWLNKCLGLDQDL